MGDTLLPKNLRDSDREPQKKQNGRNGQGLEMNEFDPFALKMRKLKPGQATGLADSTGNVSRAPSGMCTSGHRRSTAHYVSFWKLCSCRFGMSQIHWQSTPPFRKIQDGTRKSQQLHLKGVHIFSAPCQGVVFHYFP